MLRRRIFSSAMASVMALSSIAVVANAEETAVANVKTKEDLEAYVKSFDTFRASDIYEYGSISGEQFLNAIEYADNVLADDAASAQDYTVAYDMIESIYNRLKIYSVEELKALLAKAKGAYDRGNILNEDLNDLEYQNGAGQYDAFAGAYSDAEGVLDSSDSRLITDAYETLEAAYNGLTRCDIVTKAQFRTALKDYETMLQKEFDHEAWRRGAITSDWNSDVADWWKYQGAVLTYGGLYDLLDSWTANIYDQYEIMDQIKTLNKTSDENIVSAYKQARDALAIVSSWKADDTDRAVKANVTKLMEKYHNVLLFDYAANLGEKLVADLEESGVAYDIVDANYGSWNVGTTTVNMKSEADPNTEVSFDKTTSAAIKIKATSANIYIPVTKDGYYDSSRKITSDASQKDGLYKTINKNKTVDVAQYVALPYGIVEEIVPAAAAAAATTNGDVVAETTVAINNLADKATGWYEATPGNWLQYTSVVAGAAKATEVYNALLENEGIAKLDDKIKAQVKENVEYVADAIAKIDEKLTGFSAKAEKILAAFAPADTKLVKGTTEDLEALINEIDAYLATNEIDKAIAKCADIWSAVGEASGWNAPNQYWDLSHYLNGGNSDGVDYDGAKVALEKLRKYLVELLLTKPEEEVKGVEPNTKVNNTDNNGVIDGGSGTAENTPNWGIKIFSNPEYQVDLDTAVTLAQFYLTSDKDTLKAQSAKDALSIYDIDTNDMVGAGKAYGSSLEWTLVHRYLKYALADKYDAVSPVSYTKADVVALIDKAYALCEDTGDAALFEVSHNDVAELRKVAIEWLKLANKDKMYKDWNTYEVDVTSFVGLREYETMYLNSTQVYNLLMNGDSHVYDDFIKGEKTEVTVKVNGYAQLEKEYNAFKYSFGEIAEKIYLYEDMIDAGELEATDALVAAIEETAYRLAVVKTLVDGSGTDLDENDAFSGDRFFQGYNRVYTNGGKLEHLMTADGETVIAAAKDDSGNPSTNYSHEELKVAFEALEAEVKAQTEVTVLKGDVNGDGVVNAFDASALLKNIVNSVAMDAAVADYDANGVVNALDASAILKAIVNA